MGHSLLVRIFLASTLQVNVLSENSEQYSASYHALTSVVYLTQFPEFTSYAVPSEVLHENVDFIDVHKLGLAFSFKIVTVLSLSNAQVKKEMKPTPAKNVMFRLSFGSGFDEYT